MKKLVMAFLCAFVAKATMAETSIGAVEYWDSYAEEMRESEAKYTYLLTPETTTLLDGCWYVVDGEVTVNETICLENTAYIILKDGAKLTVNSGVDTHPGIRVRYGYSDNDDLYIYGQKLGTGELVANGGRWAPGIGGGRMSDSDYERWRNGGNIYLYGGHVTANGGWWAPGIGGSRNNMDYLTTQCGEICIYGGHLSANGGTGAPGIGGVYDGPAPDHDVYIYGGELKAVSGEEGVPAIGAGKLSTDNTLRGFKAMGSGYYSSSHTDWLKFYVAMQGERGFYEFIKGTLNTDYDTTQLERRYLRVIIGDLITNHAPLSHDKWYIETWQQDMSFPGLTVDGQANILMASPDDVTVTGTGTNACPGIRVSPGNTLNIDGFAGRLRAVGGAEGAGIGGGKNEGCGVVNIYGGTVEATGTGDEVYDEHAYVANGGAGIGGGYKGGGGEVNVYGGKVLAHGGAGAAGIGGGCEYGNGGKVNVYGGTVDAHGQAYVNRLSSATAIKGGAGIGGGWCGSGGNLTVYGGVVNAYGVYGGAGIGGGSEGVGATVKILGGSVLAESYMAADGVGDRTATASVAGMAKRETPMSKSTMAWSRPGHLRRTNLPSSP